MLEDTVQLAEGGPVDVFYSFFSFLLLWYLVADIAEDSQTPQLDVSHQVL